jgi:hypothetical protein
LYVNIYFFQKNTNKPLYTEGIPAQGLKGNPISDINPIALQVELQKILNRFKIYNQSKHRDFSKLSQSM